MAPLTKPSGDYSNVIVILKVKATLIKQQKKNDCMSRVCCIWRIQ